MPRGTPLPKKTKLDLFVDAHLDLGAQDRAAARAVLSGIDRSEERHAETARQIYELKHSGRHPTIPPGIVGPDSMFEDLGERAAEERK